MKWPWKREPDPPRANPDQARSDLEGARAQRPEAVELARQIRDSARRNNFIANTFHLVNLRSKP